jgi:DNA polymerase I-like protein with 3'-5' exonuclease and polymerase domains
MMAKRPRTEDIFVDYKRTAKQIIVDLETFDPYLMTKGPGTFRGDGFPVGIAIRSDDRPGIYLPINHVEGNLPLHKVTAYLKDQLDNSIPKVGAKLLYDLEWLHWLGVKVGGKKFDVQVIEALLDENQYQYNLESIAQRRLGTGKLKEELLHNAQRIDPKIKTHKDVFKVLPKMPASHVAPYALMDLDLPLQILLQQLPEIENQDMQQVFDLEARLIDVLLAMRIKGVPVNVQRAEEVGREVDLEEQGLVKKLTYLAGSSVDIWAADSIAKAFDAAGIAYPRTDKTNKPSFTAPWLNVHPAELAKTLLATRKISKFKKDFIEGMILGSVVNGRIHPQFHSVKHDSEQGGSTVNGTVSGRFSSTNPNLQQVPARDERLGPLVRSLFEPEQGCLWCKGDYMSQEPRLTVHYAALKKFSGAAEMAQRYIDNPLTDYHQAVADMCEIERRPAKNINLGLAYGMGIAKMAAQLGKTIAETKALFLKYHAGVPFVKLLANDCSNVASNRGYIRTILGRRRHFDLWGPSEYDPEKKRPPLAYDQAVEAYGLPLRRAFTHKALNALIQGSAADMVKQAMVNMYDAGYTSHLTVHDETDTSVETEKQGREIESIMEDAVKLVIPVKVDLFMEKNWGLCK